MRFWWQRWCVVYTFLTVVFSWEVSCNKPYSHNTRVCLHLVLTHMLIFYSIFYQIRLECFSKFNKYLGIPQPAVSNDKILSNCFCKICVYFLLSLRRPLILVPDSQEGLTMNKSRVLAYLARKARKVAECRPSLGNLTSISLAQNYLVVRIQSQFLHKHRFVLGSVQKPMAFQMHLKELSHVKITENQRSLSSQINWIPTEVPNIIFQFARVRGFCSVRHRSGVEGCKGLDRH